MNPQQITFLLLTLAAFGFFGRTVSRILKIFMLTRRESRFDRIPERIRTTLLVALGQTKLLKRPLAGLFHALVFNC